MADNDDPKVDITKLTDEQLDCREERHAWARKSAPLMVWRDPRNGREEWRRTMSCMGGCGCTLIKRYQPKTMVRIGVIRKYPKGYRLDRRYSQAEISQERVRRHPPVRMARVV